MLELLGNDSQVTWSQVTWSNSVNYNKGYVFFKSSKGDGILCPVRRADI